MVTLAVGPEEHPYIVHEQLLCEHAPFFRSATKEEWEEGKEHTIPLPDDDPEVVSLYLNGVYNGRISSQRSTAETGTDENCLLVKAYIFGEKIQDGRFKDAVIDAMIKSTRALDEEGHTWFPGSADVNRAYDGTPTGSPLRRLIVDFGAINANDDCDRKGLNVEFLQDLTGELFGHRSNSNHDPRPSNGKMSTCSHHEHGHDKSCYSQRNTT